MASASAGAGESAFRARLNEIAVDALETDGWKVADHSIETDPSIRLITKRKQKLLCALALAEHKSISFRRLADDTGWQILDDVERVLAVTAKRFSGLHLARAHFLEADLVRTRFDQAYAARKETAADEDQGGREFRLRLHSRQEEDALEPGRDGAVIIADPFCIIPVDENPLPAESIEEDLAPLTIYEAKRRLAVSLGVKVDSIRIIIEA